MLLKKENISNLLIGVLIFLTGVYIWFHPLDTLVVIAMYLGIIFITIGIVYAVNFIIHVKNYKYLFYGILNAVVGVVLISDSNIVALSLSIMLGLWILISSIFQIGEAYYLKSFNNSFWPYPLISAFLGIIFSFIVLFRPITGMITIAIIIGTYMVMYGIIEIIEYFIVKELKNINKL